MSASLARKPLNGGMPASDMAAMPKSTARPGLSTHSPPVLASSKEPVSCLTAPLTRNSVDLARATCTRK